MPLPLIPVLLGGAALATAAFGAKKGYDAYSDHGEANKYREDGQNLSEQAEKKLKQAGEKAQDKLRELGELMGAISQGTLTQYMELVDKLDIETGSEILVTLKQEWEAVAIKVEKTQMDLVTAFKGLGSGAAAGAIAGFGAYNAAMLVGAASTGTAISSLSGVAATNATLAWFGGGSLASGGLGMAGGAMVLNCLVAAPVIAVAATVIASKMEESKHDAKAFYDSMSVLANNMDIETLKWEEVHNKAWEKIIILTQLKQKLDSLLDMIQGVFNQKGASVSTWERSEQESLREMMQNAETVSNTINAPVVDAELQEQITELQKKSNELLTAIKERWSKE